MKKEQTRLLWRGRVVVGIILVCSLSIAGRLFFLQVISAKELSEKANKQYKQNYRQSGSRGNLYFSDGSLLVGNQTVYRLFAEPALLKKTPAELADELAPIIIADNESYQTASASSQLSLLENLKKQLVRKLDTKNKSWIGLKEKITETAKQAIERKKLAGIGFDNYEVRYYPEASMSAQVTGFIGKTKEGKDIGYFGLEGALEKELQPQQSQSRVIRDALGKKHFFSKQEFVSLNGRDITTTLDRDIQRILERELNKGVLRYRAKGGEAIVYQPKTGKILGLAALPSYDQEKFYQYDPQTYQNPSLTTLYEPGSTFKILTVAAGIDAGKITPETICDRCDGPRQFGSYKIRTWNDEYFPQTNIRDALARSDNTAMIFVSEKLGTNTFIEYLKKFAIGKKLAIDLQGDQDTPFPTSWRPVETATRSFGQGITVTSLQLIRAVGAIANDGVMMRPQIVDSVFDAVTGKTHTVASVPEAQVVSPETAQTMQELLVYAAKHGEAQWTYSKKISVAGKTGTSQVAGKGGYEKDATIASFIGFSPPNNADFLLFIKLNEPSTSPWAAETAAPLWFRIAEQISLSLRH